MNNKTSTPDGRWNWYGIEEEYIKEYKMNEGGMIEFDEIYHEFKHENRKAEVGKLDGVWGIRMWENMIWQKDELIPGHNEIYAENAAENYVFGIKN